MIDPFHGAAGATPVRPGGEPVRGRRTFASGSCADRRAPNHAATWEERSVDLFSTLARRVADARRGLPGSGNAPRADDAAAPCTRIRNPFPMAEPQDACAATGARS